MKFFTQSLLMFIMVVAPAFAADYYVSKSGSDENPGSKAAPFLTIQKAADILKPGDVCYIEEGIYSELVIPLNSGTAENPIIYRALSNADEVVVMGSDVIPPAKWIRETPCLYKAKVNMNLGHENQVFLGFIPMVEARWPNASEDLLEKRTSKMDGGSNPGKIVDNDLPEYDFSGGYVWIHASKYWGNWTGPILSQSKNSIEIQNLSPQRNHFMKDRTHEAGNGVDYYVFGVKDALDNDREWFYDNKNGELYIYRCDGQIPGEEYSIKRRMGAFDFRDKSNIEVHDISIVGATVMLNKKSESIFLDGLKMFYPYHSSQNNELIGFQKDNGVVLSGKGCTIKNSEIAYSSGSCVSLLGEKNLVLNSYIHDANYIGSQGASCVNVGGKGNIVSHNTLTRAGRSVLMYSKMYQALIQNNDMSHSGKLTSDLGLSYGTVIEAGNSEIRYNLIHDNDDERHDMGLYYDHGTQNIISHHNIVWGVGSAALLTNHYASYHLVYNNTLIGGIDGFRSSWGNRYEPDLLECRYVNNLMFPASQTSASNYYWNNNISHYQDFDVNNVMLPAEQGLGKGVYLEGITASPNGIRPGIGAIEYRGMTFKAGHDFKKPPQNVDFDKSKPAHRNLLENTAFEHEDYLSPWNTKGNVRPIEHPLQSQTNYDKAIGRIGKRSIELIGENSEVFQRVNNLIPKNEYTFIGHLRVPKGELVVLGVRFPDGSEFFGPYVARGTDKWRGCRVSFIVPIEVESVDVFARRISSGKEQVYVDDFGLVLRK